MSDPHDTLAALSADTFEGREGEAFHLVDGQENALPLTLVSVKRRPAAAIPRARRVPFSLLFHGPAEPVAAPGSYALQHEALPDLPPLLVNPVQDPDPPPPGDTDGPRVCYEIAVN